MKLNKLHAIILDARVAFWWKEVAEACGLDVYFFPFDNDLISVHVTGAEIDVAWELFIEDRKRCQKHYEN